jgi:hypothetical protein
MIGGVILREHTWVLPYEPPKMWVIRRGGAHVPARILKI